MVSIWSPYRFEVSSILHYDFVNAAKIVLKEPSFGQKLVKSIHFGSAESKTFGHYMAAILLGLFICKKKSRRRQRHCGLARRVISKQILLR
jgi:hypothetical protein